MDFKITSGFRMEDATASLDLAVLSDDELRAARQELDTVAETRGLWVPVGVGSLAVVTEVGVPSIRDQLIATTLKGAILYNAAILNINSNRKKKDHIPLLNAGEYQERAQDWLNDGRISAAEQLPIGENRPRLLIPRLNRSITTEEIVDAWKSAAGGNLWSWSGRMRFLANWPADQLSGFDPNNEDEVLFEIMPTAYDEARKGTVNRQKCGLETLQQDYPEIDAATIFEGSVLARRYLGQKRQWQDSYVRGITLPAAWVDGYDYVPYASVYDYGVADVYVSHVGYDDAARLRVR